MPTFKPLKIINEIIQHANEYDNELWIVVLNMSKAYNQVNIFMLEKALKRIRLPDNLISILTNIFKGRTNQIFTPSGGLKKPYDVISPSLVYLLWSFFNEN
ncbi:hypothetical protein RhiirA5_433417 [Rhizophagus irregularis]|uniref:Reverse transcriptase domain-containing protein n=1 Tax=Rhizophagus irregularis TaxID=588596 RepID=A0A2N0NRT4_9GLOM|nr:hypothetical protein RhiirA5_433417 [Rhizophagus irregularis]CAB5351316.1 unnamed protein product [Rhizophagus irregularis]